MSTSPCQHFDGVDTRPAVLGADPDGDGCLDCLAIGSRWVHLRRCLTCGHVGCCDSSPNRHATAHFHATGHALMQSFEPGEEWIWCYLDEIAFEVADRHPSPAHP